LMPKIQHLTASIKRAIRAEIDNVTGDPDGGLWMLPDIV
jgi:hypothetical protein